MLWFNLILVTELGSMPDEIKEFLFYTTCACGLIKALSIFNVSRIPSSSCGLSVIRTLAWQGLEWQDKDRQDIGYSPKNECFQCRILVIHSLVRGNPNDENAPLLTHGEHGQDGAVRDQRRQQGAPDARPEGRRRPQRSRGVVDGGQVGGHGVGGGQNVVKDDGRVEQDARDHIHRHQVDHQSGERIEPEVMNDR